MGFNSAFKGLTGYFDVDERRNWK